MLCWTNWYSISHTSVQNCQTRELHIPWGPRCYCSGRLHCSKLYSTFLNHDYPSPSLSPSLSFIHTLTPVVPHSIRPTCQQKCTQSQTCTVHTSTHWAWVNDFKDRVKSEKLYDFIFLYLYMRKQAWVSVELSTGSRCNNTLPSSTKLRKKSEKQFNVGRVRWRRRRDTFTALCCTVTVYEASGSDAMNNAITFHLNTKNIWRKPFKYPKQVR